MLDQIGYPKEMAISGSTQQCKPDYEALIKRAKDNLVKNEKFQTAIAEYVGHRTLRDKMAELVGELRSEEWSLNREIESLISEQEKD